MDMPGRLLRLLWRPQSSGSTRSAVLAEAERQQEAERDAAFRRIINQAYGRDR